MKRSWTAWAVASVAILAVAGCNDYGNTFQNNTGAALAFLSPSQISAGIAKDLILTVTGRGFVAKTVVQWNGKSLVTVVPTDSTGAVMGNTITATVPMALLAIPGIATVNTLSPASGAGNNGLSNPIAFVINPPPNPLPTLTSISPGGLVNGSPQSTLTLTGTSFLPTTDPSGGSLVNWSANGTVTKLAVASSNSSQITATISQALLAAAGTASVTVFNPPSPPPTGCTTGCDGGGGGGSSTPLMFTICATGQTPCPPPSPAAHSAANAALLVAEEAPAVSRDGRYVAYNAVQNDHAQIFLRDTCEDASSGCQPYTRLLSVAPDGSPANDESHAPSISSDGRYVAFSSAATNLVDNAPPGRQIYLRDTCAGAADSCHPATRLISLDPNGSLVGAESILPSISSSGRFVAFLAITSSHSLNANSAPDKSSASAVNSGYRQVFIRDTCLGASNCTPKTTRISLQPGDDTGTGTKSVGPALSGNGKHLAIAGGNATTFFTRSVAVDDGVFLAIANEHR